MKLRAIAVCLLFLSLLFPPAGLRRELTTAARASDLNSDQASRAAPPKGGSNCRAQPCEEQAIWLLRSIINEANSADILRAEARIVSNAIDLIWNRDETYARDNIKRTISILLEDFEAKVSASPRDDKNLQELKDALSILIGGLARRDSTLAFSLLKQYQAARAKALGEASSNQTLKEKLEVARESLEMDPKQSAALAAEILKVGLPNSFPQYLYELRSKNREAADGLYRTILSYMANGAAYSSSSLNFLSTYPFRERSVIIPIIGPSQEDPKKPSLGIYALPLPPLNDRLDVDLAKEYVALVAVPLLKASSSTGTKPAIIAQYFFLAKKLSGYVNRLGLGEQARWSALLTNFELAAKNAGMAESDLKYIGGYAERIANEQVAFLFDRGESLFEQAKNATDAKKRSDLLVRGIRELIESDDFDDAEKRIGTVEDDGAKQSLIDYLSLRVGRAAIKSHDWRTVITRAGKISDPQLSILLLLEGARQAAESLTKSRNKQVAVDFIEKAISSLPKVSDSADRARGFLAASSITSRFDLNWSIRLLNNAIDAINGAKVYDGDNYRAEINISNIHLEFTLANSDLETSVKEIAQRDWLVTNSLIDHISPKSVRHRAQVGACRALLS
jgi:hypothetical protein